MMERGRITNSTCINSDLSQFSPFMFDEVCLERVTTNQCYS